MVTIAYRLGIYGFLYSPDCGENECGNFGILDQRAAMKWSQKFVPFFGGNVNDALLSGCSAGGESVWWHLTHSGKKFEIFKIRFAYKISFLTPSFKPSVGTRRKNTYPFIRKLINY